MAITIEPSSQFFDFSDAGEVHQNLSTAELVEFAIREGEGLLASNGALVVRTGKYTGRTPKDKFIVRDKITEGHVWWKNNQEMPSETFRRLKQKVLEHLQGKRLYVVDVFACADPRYHLRVRFIVEKAWHALFARTLFLRPRKEELKGFHPDWVVVNVPSLKASPERDGTRGEAFIVLNFTERVILIGGTAYAGEMKKSIFSVLNFILPQQGILSMHCSANVGESGDVALFFGLSGTGKTTLSADPSRRLVGDDEHGWTEEGIFNFEGGCYAKCIHLSQAKEPQIWNAIRFGSVLENVVVDDQRVPDYDDGSITENTRCTYPVEYIEGAVVPSIAGHPKNIFFLTADAFGVLPPISLLSAEQAMEQFLLGYTAKVAGTETGITEPRATFSACFGAPFLTLPPETYARMLKEKMTKHGVRVWLVNTGWTGGPYGVGERIALPYTRAMLRAVLSGVLDHVEF
ncbi:MAG: phosphoenolpyruvate carboxykinase (ATP), partial [Candidatus Caldarchaeum sp.]